MKLSIDEIVSVTKGTVLSGVSGAVPNGNFGVSIDTRTMEPGDVFFALKGENFDGHDFVVEAASKGASAVVVDKGSGPGSLSKESKGPKEPGGFVVIEVSDTLGALGEAATLARVKMPVPLVAVAGTSGKTTTKEMTAAILGLSGPILKTRGNMNNLVGLPLTLLSQEGTHRGAVVELGISELGEMPTLAGIAKPDVAVITNVGRGHLEGLHSLEGVAEAKGELFRALGPKGTMVVNIDDPHVVRVSEEVLSRGTCVRRVTFGAATGAEVRISEVTPHGVEGLGVTYEVMGKELCVSFCSPLVANAYNAGAAIGAARALGASLEDAGEALSALGQLPGRMEVTRTGSFTLLDDTYNANPDSVAAALSTLGGAPGRKVAVLGDMLELGDDTVESHRGSGSLAARVGASVVVAIGRFSKETASGALEGGLKEVYHFNDNKEALSCLGTIIKEEDTVLVKGSRAAGLDEVVVALKGLKPSVPSKGDL